MAGVAAQAESPGVETPPPALAAARVLAPLWNRVAFFALALWVVGAQSLEGLATAGLVLCIICALAITGLRSPLGALMAWWPLAAFLAWALVVPTLAGNLPSGAGLGRLSDWIALPAVAVVFPIITSRQRWQLCVLTAGVVVAFLQYRGWWPNLETMDSLHLGWTKMGFSRAYEPIATATDRFYGVGLAFHRLRFSDAGGLIIVLAFAVAIQSSGSVRIAAGALIVFGLAALVVATQARAASAALVLTLGLMLLQSPVRRRDAFIGLGGLALLVVLVAGVSNGVRRRFSAIMDRESNGDRAVIWHVAGRAVRAHPFAGVGLGQYRASKVLPIEPETPPNILEHPGKAHNQFFSFAAEIGIPGALLFAWLLAWLFFSFHGAGQLLGRGAMLFFVLLSCFHDPLYHATVSMAVVLLFGIAKGLSEPPSVSHLVGSPDAREA